MVFPFGSLVHISSFIAADGSVGEINSFHLIRRQHFAKVNTVDLPPFNPQVFIVILEIYPIFDATENAIMIVI